VLFLCDIIIETTTNENPFPFVQLPPTKQKDMKELLIRNCLPAVRLTMTAYPTLVMRTSFVLLVFAVDGKRLPRKEL
jgi:hypothetical protein